MSQHDKTDLVWPSIERASGVDSVDQVVRVMFAPVPTQNVCKALTESLVFPALNSTTYERSSRQNKLVLVSQTQQLTIDVWGVSVPNVSRMAHAEPVRVTERCR